MWRSTARKLTCRCGAPSAANSPSPPTRWISPCPPNSASPTPTRSRGNTDKTPLCIHRAPLGTHERLIGFLIEHYAGNFPLWLAPDQVRVITIGAEDDPASAPLVKYARDIASELRGQMVRVSTDFGNNPIKAKIQDAEQLRIHPAAAGLVIGGRDPAVAGPAR